MMCLKKIIVWIFFSTLSVIKLYGDDALNFSLLIMNTDEIECERTEKKNLGSCVEVKDNQKRWFIYVIRHREDFFKQISNVIAAHLHKLLLGESNFTPTIKFLIAKHEVNGKDTFQLIGSVNEINDEFKPFWGHAKDFTAPRSSEYDKNYAIWLYLGMPISPDPDVIGFTERGNKVMRYDYFDAFRNSANRPKEDGCIDSAFGKLSHYKCDLDIIHDFTLSLQSKKEIIRNALAFFKNNLYRIFADNKEDLLHISEVLSQVEKYLLP